MKWLAGLLCVGVSAAHAQPAGVTLGDAAGLRAVVRADRGGRLASLQLRGRELLTTPNSDAGQFVWGNSCWTMPQSVWNWPPPNAHDEAAYQLTGQTANSLQLTGPPDPQTGFSLTKSYMLNAADSSLTVGCTYTNTSQKARWIAPWEISRSPRGGVVLLRVASVRKTMDFPYTPQVSPDSLTAYVIPPLGKPRNAGSKINIDAVTGWLAYARDGLLLIKQFTNVPTAHLTPNEGDAEVYVSQQYDYVELEETGRYQFIQPGQSVQFEVRWSVRKLPVGWSVGEALPGNVK